MPRSRSRTRTPTLSSHTATTGPSARPVGSRTPHTLRPVFRSTASPAARCPAKKTASSTLANSAGWKEKPPNLIQMRAPLTGGKKTGSTIRVSAAATGRKVYRRSIRWSRTSSTTRMNRAAPAVDQTSCEPAAWSCGVSWSRRWISTSPMPLSSTAMGSSSGSAYGAVSRTAPCASRASAPSPAAYRRVSGGGAPCRVSPTTR